MSVRPTTEVVGRAPQTYLLSLLDVFYMLKLNIKKKKIQLKILLKKQGGRYTLPSILTLMYSSDESKDLLQLANRDDLL